MNRIDSVTIAGYEYRVSACKSCKAPIVWAKVDPSEKLIPLDVLAAPTGNLVVVRQDQGDRGPIAVVRYLRRDEQTLGVKYTTHFATCPNATRHRRG